VGELKDETKGFLRDRERRCEKKEEGAVRESGRGANGRILAIVVSPATSMQTALDTQQP
jgi:hypothetical protein